MKLTLFGGKTISQIWSGLFFFAIGAAVGIGMYTLFTPNHQLEQTVAIREHGLSYRFIHPLLAIGRPTNTASAEYRELANSINNTITEKIKSGTIDSASVYFIDYESGGSLALNDTISYDPASLLKIVVMIAYYKQAEVDPRLLDQPIVYTPDVQRVISGISYASETSLRVGQSYTTTSLLEKMIADSDNGATYALLAHIDQSNITDVYRALGLDAPASTDSYTISIKDYSLFFRILYNATYLSPTYSEKALELLSKTTFADGIIAGLPKNTLVAHKWGEHVLADKSSVKGYELHDCGIVYKKDHPYLMCVMTKGKTINTLSETIATITKMIDAGAH